MTDNGTIVQGPWRAFASHDAEQIAACFTGDAEWRAPDDRVIVEETMSATLANGNRYINDYCFIFELRDGLIHRIREYMDTARGHRAVFGTAATKFRSPVAPDGMQQSWRSTFPEGVSAEWSESEAGLTRGRPASPAQSVRDA